MAAELTQLFQDLDLENLRIRRPAPFIFFCGGAVDSSPQVSFSLRHYLLKERQISNRLSANIILAEEANHLYCDTEYKDLISFEEDIARISEVVLLIAESPGSLAELGAFASFDVIRKNLAVLIQSGYDEEESFIRYGPIQRLITEDNSRVAVYPWRTNKSGKLIKSSISSHYMRIATFVKKIVPLRTREELLSARNDLVPFL